jgi:hypothetical protein
VIEQQDILIIRMFSKAIKCELGWDLALSGSVDSAQRWVLSAMQRHGQELVVMLWRILGNDFNAEKPDFRAKTH